MKAFFCAHGAERRSGRLLVFVVLIAVLMTLLVPMAGSEVYGAKPDVKIRYLDIDGTILKEGIVSSAAILDPPDAPYQKGMRFLGWDKYLGGHEVDTDISAVYELIMTTTKEENGKLARAGTAEPPAEVAAVPASTSSAEEPDDTKTAGISDDDATATVGAVTSPETIEDDPVPRSSGESTVSGTTVALLILAGVVVLALGFYIIFIVRKRRRDKSASI